MIDTGYIRLYRKLYKSEVWERSNPEQRNILIVVLWMAVFKPQTGWEWEGGLYYLEPGQFIATRKTIADVAGRGITPAMVRTALNKFRLLKFIKTEPVTNGIKVTILKWKEYQFSDENSTDQLADLPENSHRPSDQPSDRPQGDENPSNDSAYSEEQKKIAPTNAPTNAPTSSENRTDQRTDINKKVYKEEDIKEENLKTLHHTREENFENEILNLAIEIPLEQWNQMPEDLRKKRFEALCLDLRNTQTMIDTAAMINSIDQERTILYLRQYLSTKIGVQNANKTSAWAKVGFTYYVADHSSLKTNKQRKNENRNSNDEQSTTEYLAGLRREAERDEAEKHGTERYSAIDR